MLCVGMVLKSSGLFGKGSETVSYSAEEGSASGEVNAEMAVVQEAQESVKEAQGQEDFTVPENVAGEGEILDNSDISTEAEEEEQSEPLSEYKEILEYNPYVKGWLRIEGSGIDSPVVYTPTSQNYFLHRDLMGNDAESGTLFIAAIWRDGYYNTLVYGHNMRDGSGFGSLGKFSGKSFAEKHRILKFDTLYESREYELLGAFYSQIEEEELETKADREEADKEIEEKSIARKIEEEKQKEAEEKPPEEKPVEEQPSGEPTEVTPEGEKEPEIRLELKDLGLDEDLGNVDVYRMEKDEDMKNGAFRYYYFTDLTEKADYDYYIDNVKKNSIYDTGVDAEWGDELLTLSTCSYHVHNGRFVVVAKRVK